MTIELVLCEKMLLDETANPRLHQKDIAKTYALALRSSECPTIDWREVNAAIIERWSMRGLLNIKRMAWSGKAFAPPAAEKGKP